MKYWIEIEKDGNFDNWYGDYVEADSEEEALALYKQWIVENIDWWELDSDTDLNEYVDGLNTQIQQR